MVIMSGEFNTEKTSPPYASEKNAHALAGRHILLAEDSPDQQRLFARLLRQAGASVTLECNGAAAVERVLPCKDQFDAVIIDFMMPVMDGVEATRELREHGYQGVIIAITAYGNRIAEKEWLAAGADLFLKKPINPTSFIQVLAQTLRSPT